MENVETPFEEVNFLTQWVVYAINPFKFIGRFADKGEANNAVFTYYIHTYGDIPEVEEIDLHEDIEKWITWKILNLKQ